MPIRTARAGKPTGSWEVETLQGAVDAGEVLPTDLVWTSGFIDWKPLSTVAGEIGIVLPVNGEEVPSIPGSDHDHARSASSPNEELSLAEGSSNPTYALAEDANSRRNQSARSSSRVGRVIKPLLLFALVLGGLLAIYAWISDFGGLSSDADGASEIDRSAPFAEPSGTSTQEGSSASKVMVERFVRSLEGRVVKLYSKEGRELDGGLYVKDGWPYHCIHSTSADACQSFLEIDLANTDQNLVREERSNGGVTCRATTITSIQAPEEFSEQYSVCISSQSMGDTSIRAGVPVVMVSVGSANDSNRGIVFFSPEVVSEFATQMANGVAHAGSEEAAPTLESGTAECIDVSRRWVAAKRRHDSSPSFDSSSELLRIENVERVFSECEGGESREEKEYLAQHPEEVAQRMNEMALEAQNASAPQSDRDKAFAALLSTLGVAGASWGDSIFIVKAKADAQAPIETLCPTLVRIAEPVGMAVTLEYFNESGESARAKCPTQAEQSEIDARNVSADQQKTTEERATREQQRKMDECASLKSEYDSRVRSVVEESKGRNSPTPRLKQLEELYADSLRGCANDNRRESTPSNPSAALGSGTNDTEANGFVVQIGAFATVTAATSLRDRLRGEGFNAFTDTVSTSEGMRIRVRVGPVGSRADADALAAAIKAKVGLDGAVRTQP